MKMFLFLLLCLPTVLTAQWRMVSSSVSLNSTVDDSTYVIDVDFFSDLTGGGYLATGITADFLVFSQSGELYDIIAATNLTLSSGRLTIVEVDNDYVDTEGAPTGQIIVYDPQGEYVPVTPFGNSNMGNVLQGAAIAYNSKIKNQLAIASIDDTTSIINPYEGQLVYIKDAGNYQVRGAYTWSALDPASGGSGDVTGPGSSTDNAIVVFNSTTGKVIKESSATIDGSGNMSVLGNITISGTVDGRDVSDDGLKLDGMEDNATADQTPAEIRDALDGLSGANRLDISAIKNDTVTRLIQDSILVYFVDGSEVGRDTFRTPGSGSVSDAVTWSVAIGTAIQDTISIWGFAAVYSTGGAPALANTSAVASLHQYYVNGTTGNVNIIGAGSQIITATRSYTAGTTYYMNDAGGLSTSADSDGDTIDFDSVVLYCVASLGSNQYIVNFADPRHFVNN